MNGIRFSSPVLFVRGESALNQGCSVQATNDSYNITCYRNISIQALDRNLEGQFKKSPKGLNMTWQQGTILQMIGLTVSLFGWVLSCVANFLPLWKSLNLELNELETWNMGLWQTCIYQDESVMQCESYASLLALPLEIKVSRVLMLTSNGLGFLAAFFSVMGLNCLKMRDPRQKMPLWTAGGVLFCVSGIVTLVPISWVAYLTVQDFWDQTVPDVVPRWEFGEALFLGWFAGFFLILGGFLIIGCACFLEFNPPKRSAAHRNSEIGKRSTVQDRHECPPQKNADLVI